MSTPSTSEIRTWALKQGHAVGDRGRISATVVEAYTQAHKTTRPAPAASAQKSKRTTPSTGPAANPKRAPRQANARVRASVTPATATDESAARITALEAELATLRDRLGVLEKQAQADREQRAALVTASQRRRFRRS